MQCGDICCRRCLGFCLVDVPMLGVDLAYTCGRCIRRVATKPSAITGDPETGTSSYLTIMSSPMSSSSISSSCPSSPSGETMPPSPSSVSSSFISPTTPGSSGSARASSLPTAFSNALHSKKLTDSCGRAVAPFQVTVSQSRSAKLQSVCSLVGDYLDCAGAAVVLVSGNSDDRDRHVWVVAHRGLRSRLLHDDVFLSLCQKAADKNSPFTLSEPKTRTTTTSTDMFQFAAVSPLRSHDIDVLEDQDDDDGADSQDSSQMGDGEAVGCLVALDARARSDASGQRVRKTLENLARLVMDLLTEEQSILRIFESGDFKMFASNSLDLAPVNSSVFDAPPTISPNAKLPQPTSDARRKRSTPVAPASSFISSMVMNRLRRSRSIGCVDCAANRDRPVLLEEDGFDIVAHPGMNVGRRHAATSNCRMGRRRPTSSRSHSTESTSTAA